MALMVSGASVLYSHAENKSQQDPVGTLESGLYTLSFIRLEDQFGQCHTYDFPAGQPLVLLVADKKANDALDPWIEQLRDAPTDRATLVGIADVRGVPGLFRGKVRRKFQDVRNHPVLMDWKGEVLDVIRPQKNVPNIYLISKAGTVLIHLAGDATPERVQEVVEWVGRNG